MSVNLADVIKKDIRLKQTNLHVREVRIYLPFPEPGWALLRMRDPYKSFRPSWQLSHLSGASHSHHGQGGTGVGGGCSWGLDQS